MIQINHLHKIYPNGYQALKNINLEIKKGEIFALLGPNGAGKTTLINMICGIVKISQGQIQVGGFDVIQDFRQTRTLIGLVPQELTTDAFETVWNTVSFSRGLFGCPSSPDIIEKILKDLSLWEKRQQQLRTLSGGMKRRVMMAKALAHNPKVLFLDEPTAGVDVELRKSMWEQVRHMREAGVTIILTTHYIEEAEEMADRVGIINKGEIILTEEKKTLMKKLGKKELVLELGQPLSSLNSYPSLESYDLKLQNGGQQLVLSYDPHQSQVPMFLAELNKTGLAYMDLTTKQSSLEEIFVQLVHQP